MPSMPGRCTKSQVSLLSDSVIGAHCCTALNVSHHLLSDVFAGTRCFACSSAA